MNILKELFNLVPQNGALLSFNIKINLVFYLTIFIIVFLENAIIPAFFLPGDSLLIVLGILIKKGILNFFLTLSILTIAASLGSWVSYLQGKFLLKNKKTLKGWMSYLPSRSYQRASNMFNKHGLLALFISRFVVFMRTALPVIAGVSGLDSLKFQLFNWISSFIWVLILIILGGCLGHIECFF
ncbi:putative inner membrane protein [Candidatus Blochmanniella vafra str. BVAF]|uniref:Inner membrane protein n=1 Tax=Blochmanniella vafra (strain BVAF) TaxID=859654 RepID=E8Q6M5_BLOVB|nr:DedA family protein [Candidatus Blochmannia vafer]ADV33466.1 putative inner membrane protein [Candidatus Blochmannia vafer str. BVAF]